MTREEVEAAVREGIRKGLAPFRGQLLTPAKKREILGAVRKAILDLEMVGLVPACSEPPVAILQHKVDRGRVLVVDRRALAGMRERGELDEWEV